jgi:hypothetical protein
VRLPEGQYTARLYGWEAEIASGRHRVKVQIDRDGAYFTEVVFGLNGRAFPRIRTFVDQQTREDSDHRVKQAVTMVVQERVKEALSQGEALPASLEISEDEIKLAAKYVQGDGALTISIEPDSVLWEQSVTN